MNGAKILRRRWQARPPLLVGNQGGKALKWLSRLFPLCRDNSVSGFQVDVNVAVDILISSCMQNIVEFTKVVKDTIRPEKFSRLFSCHGRMNLVVFNAEYCKSNFVAHGDSSLHIGKCYGSRLFFLFKKWVEHIGAVLSDLGVLLFKRSIEFGSVQFGKRLIFGNTFLFVYRCYRRLL